MPKPYFILFVLLLFFQLHVFPQSAERLKIDSAKTQAKLFQNSKDDSAYMHTCFYIADLFMDIDMYDSAQLWLNEISARVPVRKPTYFNFYLSVNQTITYYYNGLKQIGLKEGERALAIARQLGDSIYLATAYNISGVFLMNSDSFAKSLRYFREGIRYCRQPPYAPKYLVISKPHNLYGNLGELYIKMNMYDSARLCLLKSRQLALEISSYRGVAIANNLLGLLNERENNIAAAMKNQKDALQMGLQHKQTDVALIAYGSLAKCYQKINKADSAIDCLQKGFALVDRQPDISSFFQKDFFEDAVAVSIAIGDENMKSKALGHKAELYSQLMKKYDGQITLLVEASIVNETRASLLELEASKKAQSLANTRFLILLLILVSVVVLYFISRRYHKKQLQEIEIRNQISRDLHDDVNATLSSMHLYGSLASSVWETKPDESRKMVEKITGYSKDLMSRIGDVIWSMKTGEEERYMLQARLRNYCSELLSPKNILCEFDIDDKLEMQLTNPVARKNIMLVAKEAINNIAKYSEAKLVIISLSQKQRMFVLSIKDDGKGYDPEKVKPGNGISNIKQRCRMLGGKVDIASTPGNGVHITCCFPIANISHST